MNEIINIRMEKWYRDLMDDCQTIITEAVFQSRWALVEGYHQLGKRILEENDNFERAKIYGEKIVQGLAESLNMSSRVLWYAVQFVKKYPTLDLVPEGKNITWNKIITKYLTEPKTGMITQKECWIKCPKCGHKFTMDNYNI
jgi:hypothetical protein